MLTKSKTLLLNDLSELTGIGTNSIRYHIKKLKPLFTHVPRDRYNRFLFVKNDVDLILKIHKLKKEGAKYSEILHIVLTEKQDGTEQNNTIEQSKGEGASDPIVGRTVPLELSQDHSNTQIRSIEAHLNNLEQSSQNQTNSLRKEIFEIQESLQEARSKQGTLTKINEILVGKVKNLEERLNQKDLQIESLEERVSLLVDIHTRQVLGDLPSETQN